MRTSPLAITAVLTAAWNAQSVEAFTPWRLDGPMTFTRNYPVPSSNKNVAMTVDRAVLRLEMAGFLGQEDDDEELDSDDESDEESDDDDDIVLGGRSGSMNLKLDPWDPNPTIKPRPGRFGFGSLDEMDTVPDTELEQTMSSEERSENLKIMRQIKKNDLADLRLRKDHAGWVEANNDLKRREQSDPWFKLNDRLREAVQLGEDEEAAYLNALVDKLGGPPPGIKSSKTRGYAVYTEIYDMPISANRAASMLEQQVLEERIKRGRAMAAERAQNMEKEQREWEEMMRNPGDREDKEAKARRERTMRRLMGEIEEDNKKRQERAKEMLGKLPDLPESNTASLESALEEARKDVIRLRRMRREGKGLGEVSDDADMTYLNPEDREAADAAKAPRQGSSAAKARRAAAQEATGGRPRLPGDDDVTRGEITVETESSSSTTTGLLTVEVSSTYNSEQSDPPMRKHCFQYTIRITNDSDTDTIQLLGRRFEIQTVGSSMKDIVQGEGVTGRQPILKPGEVFEYTSTAPLSVRPLGTTIIAARMKGEYKYIVLKPGQETATEEQVKAGGDDSAELGMFHFVFPEEERVKPARSTEDDDEDDNDDSDDVPVATKTATKASSSTSAKATAAASPASTLPGDSDMASGELKAPFEDSSDELTEGVRVQVSSSYRPERSDSSLDKHCFSYNVRITNESKQGIQLVSRRFEIQTIGADTKDVVQGPGVTGRQPILKPGESFEYTSTAPLSVNPMLDKTPVVARMEGEYNFIQLGSDGVTPLSSTPLQAKLGKFHFILPALDTA